QLKATEQQLRASNQQLDAQNQQLKATEQQLEKLNQKIIKERDRAKKYLNIAGVMIIALDPEGDITLINKKGAQILESTKEELIGKNWFANFIPEEKLSEVKSKFKKSMAGDIESVVYTENEIVTARGNERTMTWHNTTIKKDGKIIGLLCSGEDITQKKELMQKQEQYRIYLEKSQEMGRIGSWHLNVADNILEWTDETYRIFEIPRGSKVTYERFLNRVHPEDKDEVDRKWKAAMIGEEYSVEHRLLIEGKIKWVHQEAEVTFDDRGEAVEAIGFVQDITDRKKSEIQLRETEERLKTMIMDSPYPQMVHAEDGEVILVNKAWTEITGYTLEDIPDIATWTEKAYGERKVIVQEEIDSLYKLKKTKEEGEFVVRTKDGKERIWLFSSTPLQRDSGGRRNILSVAVDITERKKMEIEKENMKEQYFQAQKMDSIGKLAGGIAHDFNNILTSIIAEAQLIIEERGKIEGIEEILKSSKRARDLVNQLLLYSRKKPSEFKNLIVFDELKNIRKMLRRIVGENIDISLDRKCPDKFNCSQCWIMGDKNKIGQILMNLATNSRDAMPSGGRIKIGCKRENLSNTAKLMFGRVEPGKFVRLSFQDTGKGMDLETKKKIFDPFFTTKNMAKGTGLGLSVVLGIVKEHNGGINVYSEPEKGTVISIYLPRIAGKIEKADEKQGAEEPAIKEGDGEVILVIEDEKSILNVVERTLENYNYNVLKAEDIDRARKIYEREKENIDLVFSDMVLPDGIGLELLEELNDIKEIPNVLLSSGYMDEKSRWKQIKEQGIPFLQKPYDISELLKKIYGILH
ncbi:MAG: PAS domain S-box protein, partial [Elusimicrobiota bacterium]